MKIWLILATAVGVFLYFDRVAAVSEPASGGPIAKPMEDCALPQPSQKAAMVFASYYEGAAVSPVRLGEGKQGDTTSVVKVRVSRGMGPLYVVIAGSRHSILAFSGWTGRVERLIVAGRPQWPIAVTGLPADRISFVDRGTCGGTIPLDDLYKAARNGADLSDVAMVVRRPFPESMSEEERGRQKTQYRMPEAIGGAYAPETLTLSEFGIGAHEYAPHDYGNVPGWFHAADALRFHPAGLAEIDMDGIVTPVKAEPYRVLPDRAGIAQLIREGKVKPIGTESFRIAAPIELPEGLAGSMQVTFHVDPGVPQPTGDPGHSTIR